MTEVLFTVGRGLEEPSIVSQLLDVKTNPRKPQVWSLRFFRSSAPLLGFGLFFAD